MEHQNEHSIKNTGCIIRIGNTVDVDDLCEKQRPNKVKQRLPFPNNINYAKMFFASLNTRMESSAKSSAQLLRADVLLLARPM